MSKGPPDPKELGYYMALAQVGLEMVFPLGVGIALDYYFGWSPWATVIGAIFGFVGGMAHLIMLANRGNKPGPDKSKGEPQ